MEVSNSTFFVGGVHGHIGDGLILGIFGRGVLLWVVGGGANLTRRDLRPSTMINNLNFTSANCSCCGRFRRQPYSAYAVHLTTLSPPAFVGDGMLVWLLWKASQGWPEKHQQLAIYALLLWMFLSKFLKNLGHYIRYPADFLLLPVSIIFGWFHGLIKLYAMVTLDVVSIPSLVLFPTCSCRLSSTETTIMLPSRIAFTWQSFIALPPSALSSSSRAFANGNSRPPGEVEQEQTPTLIA